GVLREPLPAIAVREPGQRLQYRISGSSSCNQPLCPGHAASRHTKDRRKILAREYPFSARAWFSVQAPIGRSGPHELGIRRPVPVSRQHRYAAIVFLPKNLTASLRSTPAATTPRDSAKSDFFRNAAPTRDKLTRSTDRPA